MSDTVPPVVPPPNLTPEQLRVLVTGVIDEYKKVNTVPNADKVVAAAKDVPDLIMKASAADPALAQKWTGEALIASRSPWGSLLGGIVSWAATKYGLGWPPDICDIVAGAGVLIASFLMRTITEHPITGFFKAATPAQAAAKAATTPT